MRSITVGWVALRYNSSNEEIVGFPQIKANTPQRITKMRTGNKYFIRILNDTNNGLNKVISENAKRIACNEEISISIGESKHTSGNPKYTGMMLKKPIIK